MIINEKSRKKIIPIASGKGGVGKSLISANLSIALAESGYSTLVVDLSLGNSNLHTYLGLKNINPGIGNYLVGKRYKFNDLILPTEFENLWFIPGDVLVYGVSDIQESQRKKIIDEIKRVDVDYVILDLAPGSTASVLDFFNISNSGFIIVTPVITSMISSFYFLKNALFRFLLQSFKENSRVVTYLKNILKEKKPGDFPSMNEILDGVKKIDSRLVTRMKNYISVLQPKMILNMAGQPDDIYNARKLHDLIYDNLLVKTECMGLIYRDEAVDESTYYLVPLMKYRRETISAVEIDRIAQKIIQSPEFPVMPLDLNYYSDSYELAKIEADNDFTAIEESKPVEERFDVGELMSVIREQKKQINELRGTIRMLTMKNEF